MPEMLELEEGSLGGFSRQRLENGKELRGAGQRFSRQRLENSGILEKELSAGP